MSATARDLASRSLWEASLQRSRERREGAGTDTARAVAAATPEPGHLRVTHAHTRLPTPRRRDLADAETWQLSLGRSRTRRRAAALQFVPQAARAKRMSIGALAALTAGPAMALTETSAASGPPSGSGVEPPTTSEHHVALSHGSQGRQVRALQRALGLAPDGVFGPRTHAAVHHFQHRHGLHADGVAGPRTTSALRTLDSNAPAPASDVPPVAAWAAVRRHHHHRHSHAGYDGRASIAGGAYDPAAAGSPSEPSAKRERSGGATQAPQIVADTTPAGSALPPTAPAPRAATPPAVEVNRRAPAAVNTLHTGGASAGDERASGAVPPSPSGTPAAVGQVMAAGNRIARLPYRYGGGHRSFTDSAYDCSGSVSYALHGAGLIATPEDSSQLESYGTAGPGRYITVYANPGHTFMTVSGRRFDTAAQGSNGGSRWSSAPAPTAGYVVRHPTGL